MGKKEEQSGEERRARVRLYSQPNASEKRMKWTQIVRSVSGALKKMCLCVWVCVCVFFCLFSSLDACLTRFSYSVWYSFHRWLYLLDSAFYRVSRIARCSLFMAHETCTSLFLSIFFSIFFYFAFHSWFNLIKFLLASMPEICNLARRFFSLLSFRRAACVCDASILTKIDSIWNAFSATKLHFRRQPESERAKDEAWAQRVPI